jgi:hypothetical protein
MIPSVVATVVESLVVIVIRNLTYIQMRTKSTCAAVEDAPSDGAHQELCYAVFLAVQLLRICFPLIILIIRS